MRIGIYLFDGVEELDFAGPWEVLAAWADQFPDDGVQVFTVARDSRDIRCAKGLSVRAEFTWQDTPPLDVLVYPGGAATRGHLGDMAVRTWLRDLADNGALMTSVCTGALVLADSGLLDGQAATTHWSDLEELAGLGRDIEVRADERFVDAGGVITAAGVSAGIDMALHLIARLHSPQRARDVRRYIQYDPEPPV